MRCDTNAVHFLSLRFNKSSITKRNHAKMQHSIVCRESAFECIGDFSQHPRKGLSVDDLHTFSLKCKNALEVTTSLCKYTHIHRTFCEELYRFSPFIRRIMQHVTFAVARRKCCFHRNVAAIVVRRRGNITQI